MIAFGGFSSSGTAPFSWTSDDTAQVGYAIGQAVAVLRNHWPLEPLLTLDITIGERVHHEFMLSLADKAARWRCAQLLRARLRPLDRGRVSSARGRRRRLGICFVR